MKRLILLAALLFATPALADGARIVVPARDIARGETISDSDLTYQTVSPDRASSVVTAMSDLVGMQARRYLQAGEAVRADDVKKPVIVTKGSTVTMTFEVPGITLTATGKAMSEGGMGEIVTVLNPVSYRQISAVVTGAGQVRAAGNSLSVSETASAKE
jgi:flagella basal body P-ring formation protein FlgA